MKISFENPDNVNGLLTLTVEEPDYKADVEKTLKDYRKRAKEPGFRPGMVPMGLIKRQFGAAVKEDAINKFVGNQIYKYVKDNKIQMLGEPLPSDKQKPQDLSKEPPYTFIFDIAVAPEFKIALTGRDKIEYYNITVDDKLLDQQVDMFASRSGKYEQAKEYKDGDMLKGHLVELDEKGNALKNGISLDGAVIMPKYIKVEDQKKLFDNVKLGDVITFNPRKAYPDNDTEVSSLLKIDRKDVKDHTNDVTYQVSEIQRFVKHPVDQELFDSVFGKGTVKDEKEFREKIAVGVKAQLATDADYKFIQDVRAHCEKKVGKLAYPDALLKRIMLANNKDKDQAFVDKNYDESIKQLTWQLIKNQLVEANGIKVEEQDVKETAKEAARAQFAQYGMDNVPEEYINNYADEMLKKNQNSDALVDRTVDRKLTEVLKKVVKLDPKEISLDDFNKMMSK
ncbi:MAG: trigger factor [Prevotella sp.]|jgi:trigger factor|uniref:Trigger factor n=1 Tax=Segatella cerevisiae TaxID=2053716 RepID=A0ABT1BVT5_9BACT|nr:trigger factor [Segatella cerevisiae]MCH3995288.1 trigger factor [Prevotella sp.]MCI1247171.1 trigger factor [Prevotella sp.]MCO6025197.1 trigger factor [Segatella cerevisiae]